MDYNTTVSNSSLPSEARRQEFVCNDPLDITVATINTISFLINLFHLSVITRLESLKGTRYRHILINISLADMANTLIVTVFHSCYDFFLFNYVAGEPALRLPINSLMNSTNYISYYVFLVASIQKYLAICRPINYQSSFFVKRLPIAFVLAWIYVFSINISFSSFETLSSFPWAKTEEFGIAKMVFLSVPPNVITGVLLIAVYRAMMLRNRAKKARNQVNDTRADGEERKGAMYLIIIFILEMIVFALNVVCFLIFRFARTTIMGKIWNGFIKAPYTVANTIIYGWRTRSYQRHVRRMFGCQTSSFDTSEPSTTMSRR